MKDFAYSNKAKFILLITIISAFTLIPIFLGINVFIKASSDEVISLWYESEFTNIQQGNILSATTKLQRSIDKSNLIKGVKVLDASGRELINFEKNNDKQKWPRLSLIPTNKNLQTYKVNFYKNIYTFSNDNLKVYILTSSMLSLYVGITIIAYFFILFIIFRFFIRKEAISEEKNKAEKELTKIMFDLKTSERIANIAAQVSHDIRSPLASLNMIIDQIENIPENYRMIIRNSALRINDIANNLLSTNRLATSNESTTPIKAELLSSLIDSLISEKRFQYITKNNLQIIFDSTQGYGLFSKINSLELKRVLSNLINNSIEAINKNEVITISLIEVEKYHLIKIEDNGIGIPNHILSNLGKQGVTHGKINGSGLGLSHARSTIEMYGGVLEINSTEGKGTTLNIFLPKEITPTWFLKGLSLRKAQRLIVLDDDENIHYIWSEKLRNELKEKNLLLYKFKNEIDFTNFIKAQKDDNYLCLIDYELINQDLNGLEIIAKNNIADKSIIVSSRYEEISVQNKAQALNVKIIPKDMARSIPIEIIKENNVDYFEYIQIEDDTLLRLTWEAIAKKKHIKLLSLSSTDDFKKFEHLINKEKSFIYLDSLLGENEVRGEVFAKILHENGYKNLFLSSGFESSKFSHLNWLTCTGKECPFK